MKPVYSGKGCLPKLTFLSKKKIQLGFKVSKDHQTLLLRDNAQYMKQNNLKQMLIYLSPNPCILKVYYHRSFPVIWQSNKESMGDQSGI